MRNVVLVDGVRTGFGKLSGTLKDFTMTDLGAIALDGLLKKTGILDRAKVDGFYMGGAYFDGETHAPARFTALKSKLPKDVWSDFIERQCGSGLECINQAAANIMVGNADIMIAGGAEALRNRQ